MELDQQVQQMLNDVWVIYNHLMPVLIETGDENHVIQLGESLPILNLGLDFVLKNWKRRYLQHQLYELELYMISSVSGSVEELCQQFSIVEFQKHYAFSYGDGDGDHQQENTIITLTIRATSIVPFLKMLKTLTSPSLTVGRVTDVKKCLSNGWIETDDLLSKHNPLQNEEYFVHEKLPFEKTDLTGTCVKMVDQTTQTETNTEIDDESQSASPSGSGCGCHKYDTEYSLEMWNFYKRHSIIYSYDCDIEVKPLSDLDDHEMIIHSLCQSFENADHHF